MTWSLTLKKAHLVVAALATLAAGPAAAAWELGGGVAKRIDGEGTGVATVSYLTAQPRFPWEFMAGYIDGRRRIDSGPVDSQVFAGASKRWYFAGPFYASFGAVLNSDNTDVLSGHLQFQSALGWHSGRVGVSLRHLSNGSIQGRNRGETFVLLQVGF